MNSVANKSVKYALVLVLGVLALNALAYGCWFIAAPREGLGEFGYPTAPVLSGALYLVGLVGVAMLGAAAFALLAIFLLMRGRPGGLAVSLVLGASYLGVGLYALLNGMTVDALIYGGFGVLVTALSVAMGMSGPKQA